MKKLREYAEELYCISAKDIDLKVDALGTYLKLLLIQCNNLCDIQSEIASESDTSLSLLREYKNAINEHYRELHLVSDYASELNVTADHLNRVVKAKTGKNAKKHIQSRLVIAAKRRLCFSSLSIKELAYYLGFSNPANFSTFFKNCSGKTPNEFRRSEE